MTTTTIVRPSATAVIPSFKYAIASAGRFVGQLCVDLYSPVGSEPWEYLEAAGINVRTGLPCELAVLGQGGRHTQFTTGGNQLSRQADEQVMDWLDRICHLDAYRGFSVIVPANRLTPQQCLALYQNTSKPKYGAEATASKMAQLQFIAEPEAAVLAVANRLAAAKAVKGDIPFSEESAHMMTPAELAAYRNAKAAESASVEPDDMTDDELAVAIADAIVDSPYSPEPIDELKMDYLTILIESDTKSLKAEWAVANPGVPAPRIRNRDLAMLIWAKSLDMRAMCAIG